MMMTLTGEEEEPPLRSVVRFQVFFGLGTRRSEGLELHSGVLIALRLKTRFTDTRITTRNVSAAPKVRRTSNTVAAGLPNESDNQRCIRVPLCRLIVPIGANR